MTFFYLIFVLIVYLFIFCLIPLRVLVFYCYFTDAWWMWASPGCAVVVGVSIFTFFVEDIVNGLKNNEFTVTDRSEISVFLEHAFIRLEAWFQWFNTTHSGGSCYWGFAVKHGICAQI